MIHTGGIFETKSLNKSIKRLGGKNNYIWIGLHLLRLSILKIIYIRNNQIHFVSKEEILEQLEDAYFGDNLKMEDIELFHLEYRIIIDEIKQRIDDNQ